jgi:hypothetical protein
MEVKRPTWHYPQVMGEIQSGSSINLQPTKSPDLPAIQPVSEGPAILWHIPSLFAKKFCMMYSLFFGSTSLFHNWDDDHVLLNAAYGITLVK